MKRNTVQHNSFQNADLSATHHLSHLERKIKKRRLANFARKWAEKISNAVRNRQQNLRRRFA